VLRRSWVSSEIRNWQYWGHSIWYLLRVSLASESTPRHTPVPGFTPPGTALADSVSIRPGDMRMASASAAALAHARACCMLCHNLSQESGPATKPGAVREYPLQRGRAGQGPGTGGRTGQGANQAAHRIRTHGPLCTQMGALPPGEDSVHHVHLQTACSSQRLQCGLCSGHARRAHSAPQNRATLHLAHVLSLRVAAEKVLRDRREANSKAKCVRVSRCVCVRAAATRS
jgi:hypothetical protein